MGQCKKCHQEAITISDVLGYCGACIRAYWPEVASAITNIHKLSRGQFGLPVQVPQHKQGVVCTLCSNACQIGEGEKGFCGLKENKNQRIVNGVRAGHLQYYFDPLPTNCVGDWVCPAGTGAGFPVYAKKDGPEYGFNNLAVFYQACNFNCLYCQNWHFRRGMSQGNLISVDELTEAGLKENVSCICFFGGDPTPQIIHALITSKKIIKRKKDIFRICVETNGALNPGILKKMAELCLASGGCIKFDIKAWHEPIHRALCYVSNKQTLQNFALLAEMSTIRKEPPLLLASTLLVPGYVGPDEVERIARFIADLNPEIPYSLLAYYPCFVLSDLPTTSYKHAHQCLEVAQAAGLRRVKIGNKHLLGHAY